jgi:TPR repeat protein
MISTKKQFHPLGENQRQLNLSLTNKVVIKDLILSALMVLILVGLLPTTANAGSVVNECKTGAECVDLGFKYLLEKLERLEIILFNALAFFIHKSKIKATNARIQITRLCCSNLGVMYEKGKGVKQDDLKALKFFQKACGLNDGSGCSILGYLYGKGKGVKQDDW